MRDFAALAVHGNGVIRFVADKIRFVVPDIQSRFAVQQREQRTGKPWIAMIKQRRVPRPLEGFEYRRKAVQRNQRRRRLRLPAALERMKSLLRPGGVLGVIGLYRLRDIKDVVVGLAALSCSAWLRLTGRRIPPDVPLRDPDMTLSEIRALARAHLPGADVRRRLLWRYTLVYHG